jgi:hypothetical protein
MNFQGYLESSYRIIKAEAIILILGGLLIQLLNSVTLSILYGPLFGGYMLLVILLLRDNKKPAFNDLFNGFKLIRLLFPYFFLLLAKFIGFMLFFVPGVLFSTWWIYVLPLMVDRKIGFGEAMRISSDKVSETGFFMHMVFLLLVYVIPIILLKMLASFMPFLMVLSLLLMPFQVGCMVSLYLDQFKEIEEKVDDKQPEPSVAEKPLTPPFEKEAGAEAGKEIHPDDAEHPSADPAVQNTISGQPGKNGNSAPERPEKEPRLDSGNITEKTDEITRKNNKENS